VDVAELPVIELYHPHLYFWFAADTTVVGVRLR
jgi:hypothetical protein